MTSQQKSHQSAFTVICAPILYHVELTDAEKIIYGHISNLSNACGYCYATNAYLAEISGKSIPTIKRALKKLMDLQFLEISHVTNGKQDERRIVLSHFPKNNEENRDGSKMSHPQLKNDLPGGSKMSHRIIKEERINKKTTTNKILSGSNGSEDSSRSSSFFKCKNKIEKLEKLAISPIQKQKIYSNFDEKSILNGLEWLRNVEGRVDVGAALYDAIKHGYKPKLNKEQMAIEHRSYAKEKLMKYDSQTINGYKINLCKEYVEFSTVSGASQYFEYAHPHFRHNLDRFCVKLGISK